MILYTSCVGKGSWSTSTNRLKLYNDPINYCYENKTKRENVIPMLVIYPLRI